MKNLSIIVHTDDEQELTNQLRSMKQVYGYSLYHIEGHGIETEQDAFLSARDKVVGYAPRVRADIVLKNEDLDSVIESLRNAKKSGDMQEAYFWVTNVEQNGHL